MTAFVEIFNEQFAKKSGDQKSRMKLCFSPYFVSKLNVTPAKFDVNSVRRELCAINKKYTLANCDLLYFPLVDSNHWTTTCVNLLFKTINFFNSLLVVDTAKKHIKTTNMVSNFHKACIETKVLGHDMDSFKYESPDDLPRQNNEMIAALLSCSIWKIGMTKNSRTLRLR